MAVYLPAARDLGPRVSQSAVPRLIDLSRPSAVLGGAEWAMASAIDGTATVAELAQRAGVPLSDAIGRVIRLVQVGLCDVVDVAGAAGAPGAAPPWPTASRPPTAPETEPLLALPEAAISQPALSQAALSQVTVPEAARPEEARSEEARSEEASPEVPLPRRMREPVPARGQAETVAARTDTALLRRILEGLNRL